MYEAWPRRIVVHMLTSTCDFTRQLVADRTARLTGQLQPLRTPALEWHRVGGRPAPAAGGDLRCHRKVHPAPQLL